MTVDEIREYSQRIVSILQLSGQVVGMRLLQDGMEQPAETISSKQHRYC